MGRPTLYRSEYAVQAEKLCRLGAVDVELADFFGVGLRTIRRWMADQAEFHAAVKVGKDQADDRVEASLYHRAIGYTYDAVKIFKNKGEDPTLVPYREHVPPDTTAALAWLNNRRPDRWRNTTRHEHMGKDGGPIRTAAVVVPANLSGLSDVELAQLYREAVASPAGDPEQPGRTTH